MKGSAVYISVFLAIATLIYTANCRLEDAWPKDVCKKNPLSTKCLKKKLEKPVNVFDTISFFFKNKKKKEGGKAISTGESALSSTSSPENVYSTSSIASTATAHQPDPVLEFKRVMKNIHNLENEACGIGLEPRILGGENTMPGEFPWLARLQYKDKLSGKKFYACGGSLITSQYILTAAHCLTRYGLKLQSVRLGEYNTRMYAMDCSENGITTNDYMEMDTCEPARDYYIMGHMVHENYKRGGDLEHDIGIVQLYKRVVYTRYIQPICLPVGRYKINIHFGSDLMAAGWGMTENSEGSEIPLKTRTPWMEMEACRHLTARGLRQGQLCVGGAHGGSTCHGDSGGPLVLKTNFYENDNSVEDFIGNGYNRTILVGIISGGNRLCRIEPTLFTNVENYIWWILKYIKT